MKITQLEDQIHIEMNDVEVYSYGDKPAITIEETEYPILITGGRFYAFETPRELDIHKINSFGLPKWKSWIIRLLV